MYGLNNGNDKHNDTNNIEMGDNTGLAEDNTKSGEDMEEEDELSSVAASDTRFDQASLSDDDSYKSVHR